MCYISFILFYICIEWSSQYNINAPEYTSRSENGGGTFTWFLPRTSKYHVCQTMPHITHTEIISVKSLLFSSCCSLNFVCLFCLISNQLTTKIQNKLLFQFLTLIISQFTIISMTWDIKNHFIQLIILTRTSVEAIILSCKYSDALCWSSASALLKLLCCLNTSWTTDFTSGKRLTNFIYVDNSSALVIGEHKWYCNKKWIINFFVLLSVIFILMQAQYLSSDV